MSVWWRQQAIEGVEEIDIGSFAYAGGVLGMSAACVAFSFFLEYDF